MPNHKSTTDSSNVAIVDKKGASSIKSPFLQEKPTRTVPRISQSLYTKDLFKRSDEAVDRLKENRLGVVRR